MSTVLAAEGGYQEFVLGTAEWAWLDHLRADRVGRTWSRVPVVEGRPSRRSGHREDEGDRRRHPGRRDGLSSEAVPDDFGDLDPPGGRRVPHLDRGSRPGRQRGAFRPRVGTGQDCRVRGGLLPVRPDRIHRDEPRSQRQCPNRRGRQVRFAAGRPQGGVSDRGSGRHVHGRPRSARGDLDHHDFPEHLLGNPGGLRVRRFPARPVPAGGRRHLHESSRCRRRPGREGRTGHS